MVVVFTVAIWTILDNTNIDGDGNCIRVVIVVFRVATIVNVVGGGGGNYGNSLDEIDDGQNWI